MAGPLFLHSVCRTTTFTAYLCGETLELCVTPVTSRLCHLHLFAEKQVLTDAGVLCQSALGIFYSRAGQPRGADFAKSYMWHG